MILDGTALSQCLQIYKDLEQGNYASNKLLGWLNTYYISTSVLGCTGGGYDLHELRYCFITILGNGQLGKNDLVTFLGICLQDLFTIIKTCRHFYCQHGNCLSFSP